MKSRWFKLKQKAVVLRKCGVSIPKIEQRLGIRRSTLSSWFRSVRLTARQKEKLLNDWRNALVKARLKAVLWHKAQKARRLLEAREQALNVFNNIDVTDKHVIELALAMLYLGEGSKATDDTSLGSSDPLILKFFLSCLKKIYNFDITGVRAELYLRADQSPGKIKKFWAKELHLPESNFRQINIDKRTIGSKTYPHYKGVCNIRCGHVAIKRRLLNLSQLFCEEMLVS